MAAVENDGPADDAGLQEEDVIVSLGDMPVQSVDDLHKLLTQLPVGVRRRGDAAAGRVNGSSCRMNIRT